MAASVRVEDEAFSDRRYNRLARYAGLADADHARGKLLVLWRQCTIEQRYVLPADDVRDVLGENGVEALVRANLGEVVDGVGVRIKGAQGRIEWLEKLRENGKKGGRPRKNQKVSRSKTTPETKREPFGSENQNPPAPAPAPAPAPDNNVVATPSEPDLPPEALRLADGLRRSILATEPKHKVGKGTCSEPKWETSVTRRKWALEADRMHRIDGRDWGEAGGHVRWLWSDGNLDAEFSFRVESVAALREKWDRIAAVRRRDLGADLPVIGGRKKFDVSLGRGS